MTEQVQDVLNNFEEAMEKITGFEKTFETKLDNKFNELLARLPPPPPAAPNTPLQQQQQQQRLPPRHETDLRRASRVPLAFGQTVGAAVDTSVAPAADAEDDYARDYEDCRGIVTADVLAKGLSRGAIATRKLKGVNLEKGHGVYTGSAPYGEGKSLRSSLNGIAYVSITRERNRLT